MRTFSLSLIGLAGSGIEKNNSAVLSKAIRAGRSQENRVVLLGRVRSPDRPTVRVAGLGGPEKSVRIKEASLDRAKT